MPTRPIGCWLDNTQEALALILRPGNAGSGTASDHVAVVDAALDQLPDDVYERGILVRADSAGASHDFTDALRARGLRFSIGYSIGAAVRSVISDVATVAADRVDEAAEVDGIWVRARERDGSVRDGAWVCELPVSLPGDPDDPDWPHWPEGTRLLCRRERPHPGAQLKLGDTDGWRYTCFMTDDPTPDIAALELRHRQHARVEDRIRIAKDVGLGKLPHHNFAPNEVWCELALLAQDLIVWTQHLVLDSDPAIAEPKRLRYTILHVAGRIVTTGRRRIIRIQTGWPWTGELTRAFSRLRTLTC